jgi:hypothetical protein
MGKANRIVQHAVTFVVIVTMLGASIERREMGLANTYGAAKLYMPMVQRSLFPFVVLDKSMVRYALPQSTEVGYNYSGSYRNESKRTLYNTLLKAEFYSGAQLINSVVITPVFEAHFSGAVNYFSVPIRETDATATEVVLSVLSYDDISQFTYYPIEVLSSQSPSNPVPSGQNTHIWVFRNKHPFNLTEVVTAAENNTGYVKSPVADIDARQIMTRTFTSYFTPFKALEAQGRILPVFLHAYRANRRNER